jgi:benzoate-CoA ligase
MSISAFEVAASEITRWLESRSIEPRLGDALLEAFPPEGEVFAHFAALCRQGAREGWLCNREGDGIRFGRALKPSPVTAGFSVDVVAMDGCSAAHHRHPNGEVDLIVPLDEGATFDGRGAGWLVYGPNSAHAPVVTGRALIAYFLPSGAIEFTKPDAGLSVADHSVMPPQVEFPRRYNAAHDLIERNLLGRRGDKTAFIDDNGSYTYSELAERVNRFGNAIRTLGLEPEQRLLLCVHDGIDFPTAFLGSIKAGIVPVAVNTLLTTADYRYVLEDSRARVLVVAAELLPAFAPVLAERPKYLEHVIVSQGDAGPYRSLSALLEGARTTLDVAPTTPDDMCFWLYSSGSTGAPKGTVHVHSSLIHTAELYAGPTLGLRPSDVSFSAAKLFFAYGLGNGLTFPMWSGGTSVLMAGRPTPGSVFARLREHSATVFYGVPTLYAGMLASPELPAAGLPSLRRCASAGEALPEEIGKRWTRHFGIDILDGIGSTEMLHIFLSNRPGDVRYGTTGLPVPGYELRVVGDDGEPVAPGVPGELHVAGPTSAAFYWNQRTRSRNTFVGPWTRTGDKYVVSEDGYFKYAGRSDDMLKVSGIYVSPIEVESALIAHEAVLECAVVGKEDDDKLTKPIAFVVLRDGIAPSEELARDLKVHVKGRLAPYKYPRWIEFVAELPKTATGKIQRFKLRTVAETTSERAVVGAAT